ncbi:uncharacterized protein LOC123404600 [Hordeum vulgare subsp. vulgare]|uniref:uncharacterized protein LOC123404600 n=1 Tax=Hordeum vulgare subsp. vulgare TaxID=112509 RepID=UPI001D1A4D32|nr:uncharacterized protein LOC123404600 [Hordeum vulgare subsp. vulgare]
MATPAAGEPAALEAVRSKSDPGQRTGAAADAPGDGDRAIVVSRAPAISTAPACGSRVHLLTSVTTVSEQLHPAPPATETVPLTPGQAVLVLRSLSVIVQCKKDMLDFDISMMVGQKTLDQVLEAKRSQHSAICRDATYIGRAPTTATTKLATTSRLSRPR